MGEWLPYLQETLTTPISLVIVGAGFFGLMVGWLMSRTSRSSPLSQDSKVDASSEWQWRHEKLILQERHEVEKAQRVNDFLAELSASHGGTETDVRARLFGLAESVRLIRGRVGSDISRLTQASERIRQLKQEGSPRPDALDASAEMADKQLDRLRGYRDTLRPFSALVFETEVSVRKRDSIDENVSDWVAKFKEVREELSRAPGEWAVLTDETDRGIRELLGAGSEKCYEPLRNILLIDGAVSSSVKKSETSLVQQVDGLIRALEHSESREPALLNEEEPSEFPNIETSGSDLNGSEEISLAPEPDHGFRPAFFEADPSEAGDSAEGPSSDEFSQTDASEVESGEMVMFRSNDVELWGQEVYRGKNCRARSLAVFPDWADWISIRRVDTGERIISEIDRETYQYGANGDASGFNATNELFYGARHLGMFSEHCPNEVETRFTYGGWGFGHRVSDLSDDSESLQASGWGGKEIDADTVFEIVLHAELPELMGKDTLIERGG
ncbi:MAG: hypothetical protein AAGA96_13900 [Verrucomicrobiota bacterium]